ncbi:MAG: hypothetical protein ACRD2C_17660 [Acidimicrobiales bacterium]
MAGLSAGEQPRRVSLVADGGVAGAGGGEIADESGEWLGEVDGFVAEAQLCAGVVGFDVVDGEAADGGGRLGVEQDEQAGDAVFGFEGFVVE